MSWAVDTLSSVAYLHPGAFVVQDSFSDTYNGDIEEYEADKRAIKESIMFGSKGVRLQAKLYGKREKQKELILKIHLQEKDQGIFIIMNPIILSGD